MFAQTEQIGWFVNFNNWRLDNVNNLFSKIAVIFAPDKDAV